MLRAMPTILVAEDEPAIADAVLYALRGGGSEAQRCLPGREVAQPLLVSINAVERVPKHEFPEVRPSFLEREQAALPDPA